MKQESHNSDLFSPMPPTGRQRPVLKGRGTWTSPAGRFEKQQTVPTDDGWYLDADDLPALQLPTELHAERARRIISRNQSPDVPFDQSINPYRGCEHGCVYCYARPSHSFLNLSPGLDFETQIFYKTNAAEKLEQELLAPGYRCTPINIGANTDPYQPAENKMKLTRKLLRVLEKHNHPVTLITKGALILRDADILERMARKNLVSVAISITSLQDSLKRILEPRTSSPAARLKVIRELSRRGIPTTLLLAPIIPAINDHEIEAIVNASADAGVQSAHYIFLRLPYEVKDLFITWLTEHFPLRAKHVMNLIGASRNGQAYDAQFGARMTGTGPYAQMIGRRFEKITKQRDLHKREAVALNTSLFQEHHPAQAQLSLL